MSKRKRDDAEIEEEEDGELKGLVVHTSLDTHIFFFVSPSLPCSLLKEKIVMEHFKFFPDFGKINITTLKVKGKDGIYCHSSLPKNMQLRNALQMFEEWYFFADVAKLANHDSNYRKTKQRCVSEKLNLPRPNNDDQELVDSRQEETKVDKPKASKRKTKKKEQSERTSETVAHIINDNVEPAGSKKPEEDNERSSVILKNTSKIKEMPLTKDVHVTVQADEGEHDNLNEISAQIVSADETDVRKLEKKSIKKSNRKKVDQPSNDKLKPLKKDYQGNDHEAQHLKKIDVQDNDCEVNKANVNEKPKKKLQTKHSVSETILVEKQPLAVTQRIMTDDNMRENETNDAASPSQLCNDKLNDIVEQSEGDKLEPNKQKTKKNEENDIISQVVAEIMTDYPEEVKQPPSSGKPLENNEDASINPKKKSKRKQIKPVTELPEQIGDGLMANKNQKEEGNLEDEHLNEISVGKVSSVKANTRNLEKQTTSKSKRKKTDQPTTSVDISSNVMSNKYASEIERNSVEDHLLQIDAYKANDVDGNEKPKKKHKKKHSGSEKNVSNTPMNQQLATTQNTVNDAFNQEEGSNWSIEIENVDSQPASKLNAKNPNPSSSVDTSSKVIKVLPIDNVNDSENQQEVSLQDKPPTSSTKAKKLNNPSARKLKSKKLDNQPASKVKGKKIDLYSSVDSERNDVQEIDLSQNGSKTAQLNQISQHEEHLDCYTAKVKTSMQKKLNFPGNAPSEEEQETNGIVNVDKHKTGLSPLEEHNSEPTEIVSQEVPSTEIVKSGKPPSSKPKNNLESKEQNLNVTRNKGKTGNPSVEGSPLKQCTTVKEHKKIHMENNKDVQKKIDQEQVFKTPANKSKSVEPLSTLPEKKRVTATSGGLFDDLSSDTSDDEVERNGSSSSTRTPDDLSSSDYSEGESQGDVVESQASQGSGSAKDKAHFFWTGLSGLTLESVLRSSSRYKKAKLAASQSQLEDSEPPEFVPDSLAD